MDMAFTNIQVETNTRETFIAATVKMIKEFILCKCYNFTNLIFKRQRR